MKKQPARAPKPKPAPKVAEPTRLLPTIDTTGQGPYIDLPFRIEMDLGEGLSEAFKQFEGKRK